MCYVMQELLLMVSDVTLIIVLAAAMHFYFFPNFLDIFDIAVLSYVSEISTHVTSGQPHDNVDRISSVR